MQKNKLIQRTIGLFFAVMRNMEQDETTEAKVKVSVTKMII
jgi:hypothetical protein